uniref:Uncharacterized protein n=1 Tax=Meloidogyne javanica TaxID=6303 RepID=A0A915N916_MELJA
MTDQKGKDVLVEEEDIVPKTDREKEELEGIKKRILSTIKNRVFYELSGVCEYDNFATSLNNKLMEFVCSFFEKKKEKTPKTPPKKCIPKEYTPEFIFAITVSLPSSDFKDELLDYVKAPFRAHHLFYRGGEIKAELQLLIVNVKTLIAQFGKFDVNHIKTQLESYKEEGKLNDSFIEEFGKLTLENKERGDTIFGSGAASMSEGKESFGIESPPSKFAKSDLVEKVI